MDIKIEEGYIPPDRQYLKFMEGGANSGNHGHAGVKGQKGGSAPKGSFSDQLKATDGTVGVKNPNGVEPSAGPKSDSFTPTKDFFKATDEVVGVSKPEESDFIKNGKFNLTVVDQLDFDVGDSVTFQTSKGEVTYTMEETDNYDVRWADDYDGGRKYMSYLKPSDLRSYAQKDFGKAELISFYTRNFGMDKSDIPEDSK